ncbi:TPA: exosporium leader peptide-containing protein [Bacillus cereus]|nr:exosporium leader peptide-containing protein [Bacillus cereus]HDR6218669.1 exosporium leader peptide-containing protein [Bacillus cereus]HDR6758291.1 exosporium leader peptide-containing protein [Bacillus cereus]HDR6957393.1 exosporium leader peptide-containing protein [Bacillus cereus]
MDKFLSFAVLNPDSIGPTLPPMQPFQFPSGHTGSTGTIGATGLTGSTITIIHVIKALHKECLLLCRRRKFISCRTKKSE